MIDSDIFKKGFVKSLEAPYKLLWIYILTDCNHAGIWEVELDVACLRLGIEIEEKNALQIFEKKIQIIDSDKWFLPSFISFQYGELNEKNRVHNSVLQILRKYKIRPLEAPLEGAKDKDKDKEKDKDKDKGGLGENFKDGIIGDFETPEYESEPERPTDEKIATFNAIGQMKMYHTGPKKGYVWNKWDWDHAKQLSEQIKTSFRTEHNRDPTEEEIFEGFMILVNSGHFQVVNNYSISTLNSYYTAITTSIKNGSNGSSKKPTKREQLIEATKDLRPGQRARDARNMQKFS